MIGGLLHPLLAFGMLAAFVPLIIHLFNRRRHEPLDWAAMRFARAAWKRIRRRTRFENLILLLLRMAAVAVFALALARPFTSAGGPLGGLSKKHREVVVLLDGSASMGWRIDLESVWDRALARARGIFESLDGASGDRVHFYLVGQRPRRLSNRSPDEALSMLSSLEAPLAEGADLGSAIGQVLTDLEDERVELGPELELLLITDVQRRNFIGPNGPLATDELEQLAEHKLRLEILDVTGAFVRRPADLAITAFVPLDPFGDELRTGRGSTVVLKSASAASFLARVANSGESGRDVNIALVIDGERRPSKRLFVPGASTKEIELEASLIAAGGKRLVGGFREIEVTLEADALEVDNSRSLVALAPGALGILIINGSPAADFESDEVAYLRAALEPPDDGMGPFSVTEKTPNQLSSQPDLAGFDLIWMANVEDPSEALVQALAAQVKSGATLAISLGDRVIAQRYNESLGAAGLLGAELIERKGDPSRRGSFRRARIDAPEHPALAFFSDERYQLFFTEVPIFEYFEARPAPEARVLASLDDRVTKGSPLLIEANLGRGRTLLFTSTIDNDWALLAQSPTTLIPLTHELAFSSVAAPGPARNLSIGDSITAHFESFPDSATLVSPSGSATRIDATALELPNNSPDAGAWSLAAIDAVDQPGIWRVSSAAGMVSFAASLDPAEGLLERLSIEELGGLSPVFQVAERTSSQAETPGDDGELFRILLAFALCLLIAEALWARRLTRERT